MPAKEEGICQMSGKLRGRAGESKQVSDGRAQSIKRHL